MYHQIKLTFLEIRSIHALHQEIDYIKKEKSVYVKYHLGLQIFAKNEINSNLAPLHDDFFREMFQHLNFHKEKLKNNKFMWNIVIIIHSVFFSH